MHKQKDIQELHFANEQLMAEFSLQNDPRCRLLKTLSCSRLEDGAVAYQNAIKLNKYLEGIQWNKRMGGFNKAETPPISKDSIPLGVTCLGGKDYCLNVNDLTQHSLACGCSGSGKSTVIGNIIMQVALSYSVIFFDHKDEGGRFLNLIDESVYSPLHQLRWNCLESAGDQEAYIRYLAAEISRLAALVNVTSVTFRAKLLAICSNKNDLPAFTELSIIFRKIAEQERRNNLVTAARACDDLSYAFGKWAAVRKGISSTPKEKLMVYPLKDLPTAMENFFISLLFKQHMDCASLSGHTSHLKRLYVFDEGRGFFGKEMASATSSGRTNVQTEIMTKARSYGMGVCLGTQSATMLQSSVVDNVGTFIALRTNSEHEAKYCCRRLGLDDNRYRELMELNIGEAWVVSPRCTTPTKIRIPYTDLGDYPSYAEIETKMQPVWNVWDTQTVFAPSRETKNEVINFKDLLGEEGESNESCKKETTEEPVVPSEQAQTTSHNKPEPHQPPIISEYLMLMKSCQDHPEFGVSEHYRDLNWSAGKGSRIVKKLIEADWIVSTQVISTKGGRPRKTLQLTEKGEQMLHEC